MKRRDFLKGISTGLLSAVIAPDILGSMLIKSHTARITSIGYSYDYARITVIGIGLFGANVARLIARNVNSVECHEVLFNPAGNDLDKMTALFATVRKSDLLFVTSGFDDDYCKPFFEQIAETARSSEVLTVGIIPDGDDWKSCSPDYLAGLSKLVDTLFRESDRSVNGSRGILSTGLEQRLTLTGYAIRHTIATIADLLSRPGMICIDFADVKTVLLSGNIGRIGVGVANDDARGATAAMLALERLDAQQVVGAEIAATLVCLHGSYDVTMDDYEEASRVIHGYLPEESNIIVGMLIDEQMGSNVRVTIMTVMKG